MYQIILKTRTRKLYVIIHFLKKLNNIKFVESIYSSQGILIPKYAPEREIWKNALFHYTFHSTTT